MTIGTKENYDNFIELAVKKENKEKKKPIIKVSFRQKSLEASKIF